MNPVRFAQPAGQLVQRVVNEETYWAFVPDPLPPVIEFDPELATTLAAARGSLGELSGLGRAIPNPSLLIHPFIRREAVLSSKIEGTLTDIADLYAYEAGQPHLPGLTDSPPPEADVREVSNYVHALEYGLDRIKSLPISLRLIRELHERLLAGARGSQQAQPGEFRRGQNLIGKSGDTLVTARFVPPPPPEMLVALDTFEKYLHSPQALDPLIRLALIHYQFEAIHPFGDGNGRIGRLLISLLLVHWGLLPLPLLYLSAYFEKHRDGYYDRLLAVSQNSAWRDWLVFFLRGVEQQAQDAVKRSKQLQDLQSDWRARAAKAKTTLPVQLVDALFENPVVSISDVARRLSVSYNAAQRAVDKLVELQIIGQAGDTSYGKTFIAWEILKVALQKDSA